MDKKTERTSAKQGLGISLILIGLVVFFHLLGSDLAKEPGFWRNARMTMEILLGDLFYTWEAVYEEKLLVRLLIWVLSALPVVFAIGYAVAWIGGYQTLFHSMKNLMNVDRDEMAEPEAASTKKKNEAVAPKTSSECPQRLDPEKAMKGLNQLRAMYDNEENVFQDREPCVRVQQLGGGSGKQIDMILDWFGSADSRYAAVKIDGKNQYELLLTQNDKREPCIIGLGNEDDEDNWSQCEYALDRDGDPLLLKRQSGKDTVTCYALTWLGGSKL